MCVTPIAVKSGSVLTIKDQYRELVKVLCIISIYTHLFLAQELVTETTYTNSIMKTKF